MILRALAVGVGRALAAPLMLLGLWLCTVLTAMPAAVVVTASLHDSLRTNLAHEEMQSGFNTAWFGEFKSSAKGLEKTFRPSVAGAGPFLDNFEGWLSGRMFRVHAGLVAAGVLFALFWTLLMGGVLERFAHSHERGPSTSHDSCDSP